MGNKKILTLFSVKQFVFFVLGIVAAIVFFVMTPFEGLPPEGMKVLGLFLMAIFWWMGSVFPDYVTAFWMMALMIATGASSLGTVFSAPDAASCAPTCSSTSSRLPSETMAP